MVEGVIFFFQLKYQLKRKKVIFTGVVKATEVL